MIYFDSSQAQAQAQAPSKCVTGINVIRGKVNENKYNINIVR